MSRLDDQYDYMDLDDSEELLADKPCDEKWELIGGRVVNMMVGARWEHHFIVQDTSYAVQAQLRAEGSPCPVFTKNFRLKESSLKTSVLPDVMVHRGPLLPGAASLDAPTALVEVMSNRSVGRDRVEK